jgi:glycosyltransferase involved in cell wall biosynthesis
LTGTGVAVRVAFDVTVPARAVTGVGVYARELAGALAARGVDLRAWRRRLGPGGPGLPRLANAFRLTAWLVREVPRRARREGVSVYHAATSIGPLRAGCPAVMTVHDATLLTMRTQYGPVERLYHRVFSVAAARRAAAVIVPSRASREAVGRAYGLPPARLHLVPHGVAARFRPVAAPERAAALARHGLAAPYVLFVGAQPPRKNLPRLIRAFAAARADPALRGTHLVIAGPAEPGDPGAARLGERLGVGEAVRWLGAVSDGDLPALYSGALCLAYPSLAEGFGFPVVEAMACGAAVLTADRSATAEVAGDAALLVDPEDQAAIAAGLRRLGGDRDLAADLGARGRERARAFSWARTAEGTEAVYRAVAEGRRP